MDSLSKERRSWNMSRIRSANTKPELRVRSAIHRLGYRFRLSTGKSLPGKPDIVLVRHKIVVLVHGCFWHRHRRCKFAYTPKSRRHFWDKKFTGNVKRDKLVRKLLRRAGWRVIEIWECETRDPSALRSLLAKLLSSQKRKGKR